MGKSEKRWNKVVSNMKGPRHSPMKKGMTKPQERVRAAEKIEE